MTRRDFVKPAFSLRKKRFVKTHALSLLGTTRLLSRSGGYDHRGHCYILEHKKFGELGRIVLIKVREQEMLMQAELYKGQEKQEAIIAKKKKEMLLLILWTGVLQMRTRGQNWKNFTQHYKNDWVVLAIHSGTVNLIWFSILIWSYIPLMESLWNKY